MAAPDDYERKQAVDQAQVSPPGHFLSAELQSDCVRFLEDVHTLVRRREQEAARLDARLWA